MEHAVIVLDVATKEVSAVLVFSTLEEGLEYIVKAGGTPMDTYGYFLGGMYYYIFKPVIDMRKIGE